MTSAGVSDECQQIVRHRCTVVYHISGHAKRRGELLPVRIFGGSSEISYLLYSKVISQTCTSMFKNVRASGSEQVRAGQRSPTALPSSLSRRWRRIAGAVLALRAWLRWSAGARCRPLARAHSRRAAASNRLESRFAAAARWSPPRAKCSAAPRRPGPRAPVRIPLNPSPWFRFIPRTPNANWVSQGSRV